jgi:hypothetical protein
MYCYRRRVPLSLASCRDRPHLFLSLGTREPKRARALGALLDAVFGEIAMSTDATFLTTPQLDAMLRSVISAHSEKLNRVAAAGKSFAGFDAADAARTEYRVGWAYKLYTAQGTDAVVQPADRAAMKKTGLNDFDIDLVDELLDWFRVNRMVPTPRGRLEALVAGQGALPTPMNLASAQEVYYRGLSLANFDWPRRYGGVVPDAA